MMELTVMTFAEELCFMAIVCIKLGLIICWG